MKTIAAWVAGIWELSQLALFAVKIWVRPDWPWAIVLLPLEILGAVLVVVTLLLLYALWLLNRSDD